MLSGSPDSRAGCQSHLSDATEPRAVSRDHQQDGPEAGGHRGDGIRDCSRRHCLDEGVRLKGPDQGRQGAAEFGMARRHRSQGPAAVKTLPLELAREDDPRKGTLSSLMCGTSTSATALMNSSSSPIRASSPSIPAAKARPRARRCHAARRPERRRAPGKSADGAGRRIPPVPAVPRPSSRTPWTRQQRSRRHDGSDPDPITAATCASATSIAGANAVAAAPASGPSRLAPPLRWNSSTDGQLVAAFLLTHSVHPTSSSSAGPLPAMARGNRGPGPAVLNVRPAARSTTFAWPRTA